MLKKIRVRNFKPHEALDIDDIPLLAVLVGQNNSGKSSILQAVAIPKYGIREEYTLPIGSGDDIIRYGTHDGEIELTYAGVPAPLLMKFGRGGGGGFIWQGIAPPRDEDPAFYRTYYISWIRSVSRTFSYEQFPDEVGILGQNTWNILHQFRANKDARLDSVEEWMKRMGMGIASITTPTAHPGSGSIFVTSHGVKSNLVLQGSGAASVLPIVVQGILSKQGDTILLEEPDSHLHRAAIDALLRFLGDCASRGVQVICTTHSIDFLASLSERVASKEIPADSGILHLQRDQSGKTSVTREDPKVFYGIRTRIKEDLAGRSL